VKMKKKGHHFSSTEIRGAFARRDWAEVAVILQHWDSQPCFDMSFGTNEEEHLAGAHPTFWLVFKLAVDTGRSPPNKREPPTLRRLRQGRLDCRGAAMAVLGVAKRRMDIRRWIPRDVWRLIARMVWAQRWEFYDDDGGVPNG
jgi:hypothetical protein